MLDKIKRKKSAANEPKPSSVAGPRVSKVRKSTTARKKKPKRAKSRENP